MSRFTACKPILLVLACVVLAWPSAALAQASDAAALLRERYQAALRSGPLPGTGLPLALTSIETGDALQGEVLARVDHPFDAVRQALSGADRWCAVLILHLNVKYCRRVADGQREQLAVGLGRKFDQPLAQVHWAWFEYRTLPSTPDHLALALQAPHGPMGTHDYRITLEAAPLDAGHTVLRLAYAYGYGTAARWALRVYLATMGADKQGFSLQDGVPVGGLRGVVERNTMRYYLAIAATLDAARLPPQQQLQRRLEAWFDATERHARQLHEMERDDYLRLKQQEVLRMQAQPPPGG